MSDSDPPKVLSHNKYFYPSKYMNLNNKFCFIDFLTKLW